MDHLSHPLFGQSQTAHHQPHFHRRSRPATLRLQGRLSCRILRRRSPHRLSPDLRGCLCSPARGHYSRAGQDSPEARRLGEPRLIAGARNIKPACPPLNAPAAPSPHPQISPALPRPPLPHSQLALARIRDGAEKSVNPTSREAHDFCGNMGPEGHDFCEKKDREGHDFRGCGNTTNACSDVEERRFQRRVRPLESVRALAPVVALLIRQKFFRNLFSRAICARSTGALAPEVSSRIGHCPNCECPMNSSCGKQFHHPSIKPVIVEDTTHGVSLLTGTISGSNFAFP